MDLVHDVKDSPTEMELLKSAVLEFLKSYDVRDHGYRELSNSSEVSVRTLKRIVSNNSDTRPYPQTCLSIYRAILGEDSDNAILKRVHPVMKSFLSKCLDSHVYNSTSAHEPKKDIVFSKKVSLAIREDGVYRELFAIIQTRNLKLEEVQKKYGDYGLKKLREMEQDGVLQVLESGTITRGLVQYSEDDQTSYQLSRMLSQDFYNVEKCPQRGENIHRVALGPVNKMTYNEILKVQDRAAKEIFALTTEKANAGEVPVWSINMTDTTSESFLNPEKEGGEL